MENRWNDFSKSISLQNEKYLVKTPVHTLTYYDITFITEGVGSFSIDNQIYEACPGDVVFSKPGEIRIQTINLLSDYPVNPIYPESSNRAIDSILHST